MMATQVTSTQQVVVTETAANVIELQAVGPQGPPGVTTLANLSDVDASGTTDRSLLIYNAAQQKWISSGQTTVEEVLNCGNF